MNKKMSLGMLITFTGAMMAYQIGSGFASGQETVQYYSSWGSVSAAAGVMLLNILIASFTFIAYAYAGREHNLEDMNAICSFYVGKVLGKAFVIFAWVFNACCYLFMISGFGSTLNQQFGVNIKIGVLIAVVLSVVTAVLGLKKLVNIIGKIGPVIAVFTMIIGAVAAFYCFPHVNEGLEAINSGQVEVLTAGPNWLFSGLSLGGCTVLLTSAFNAKLGIQLRKYKFVYTKIILLSCIILLGLVSLLMGVNHIGNIWDSTSASIPNLLLANKMVSGLDIVFAVIILLAIYTTICSSVWACASTLEKNEKSPKYKFICVGIGVIGWIVAANVPYELLVNYIMTYCGYTGMIVFACITVRYFVVRARDKKKKEVDTVPEATPVE